MTAIIIIYVTGSALALVWGFCYAAYARDMLKLETAPRYSMVRDDAEVAKYQAKIRDALTVIKGGFLVWPLVLVTFLVGMLRDIEKEANA